MNDIAIAPEPVETASTVIDTETDTRPSGGGTPRSLEDNAPAPSLRDTIAAVVKEGDEAAKAVPDKAADVEKDAEKPAETKDSKVEEKPDAKAPERAADGKFAAKAKPEGEAQPEAAKPEPVAEGKHYTEPPKNFLPDSKEMYRNVPRSVRRDIAAMEAEHTATVERLSAETQRYASIKPFDDLARSNGRDLRESLTKMNEVENAMQRDPVFGLNQILSEIGPRKQDGSPITIYELAQHIVGEGPQGYQDRMQRAYQAQPRAPDPRLAQMNDALSQAQEQLVQFQVIEPFKAAHPRYDELEDLIVKVLSSDMLPRSLSAEQRLEAAYVYAERLSPPSAQSAEIVPAPAPESRVDASSNGGKSIKSALGEVSNDMEPERGGSIRELLQDEMKRMKRSG